MVTAGSVSEDPKADSVADEEAEASWLSMQTDEVGDEVADKDPEAYSVADE